MPVARLHEVDSCEEGISKIFLVGRKIPLAAARLTCCLAFFYPLFPRTRPRYAQGR